MGGTAPSVLSNDTRVAVSKLEFRGIHDEIYRDTTYALDVEGALASGKTTLCLAKELDFLRRYPGMSTLIARWTDDAVKTLLRPAWEQTLRIEGVEWDWDEQQKFYALGNGSRAFAFGLKTQSSDPDQRFGKIRGASVSRVYVDQAEQLPPDYLGELILRMRPDVEARLRGDNFPRQLTFSPNPGDEDGPIAKQFPSANRIKGRRYYAISIYDNRHNLPEEMLENALISYPPEHPKHRTMILGLRGLNVDGEPVYDGIYDRAVHARPLTYADDRPLLEVFEFGRHNPVWMVGQRTYYGGLHVLAGVIGKRMVLEDFLPIVKQYRSDWFPAAKFHTCCAPMGESQQSPGRMTLNGLLRDAGYRPIWRQNANAPDVQLAMIEYLAGLLRRRTLGREEAFGLNTDPARWLSASPDRGVNPMPFLSYAFEGGYVWDKNAVSISNKTVRQPHADDLYANVMKALENLALNFCTNQSTDLERDQRANREQQRQIDSGYPTGPASWMGW